MVDLVKIRKKLKKKEEEEKEKQEQDQRSAQETAQPDAPSPLPSERVAAASPVGSTSEEIAARLERFKAEAAARRARAELVAEEQEQTEADEERLEVLSFVIGGEQYALPIEHVLEIVTPRPITRVPNAEPGVIGIISLRGTIVTLLDVRSRLRHPSFAPSEDQRLIVVEHHGEILGFEVDRVLRVTRIDPDNIEPQPVAHSSEEREAIRGVIRRDDALTILLDFDKLLDGASGAASPSAAQR